jgi:hypothetical protein
LPIFTRFELSQLIDSIPCLLQAGGLRTV